MPRFPRIVIPGAPHHVTQRGNNRLDVFFVDEDRRVYLALLKKHGADWKELLQKSEDEALLHAIRLHTRTGRPLASDSFISKIETLIGRRLRPLPIGRPPKMPPIKAENELNGIKK